MGTSHLGPPRAAPLRPSECGTMYHVPPPTRSAFLFGTNPGLCGSCRNCRIVTNDRDSQFYLCLHAKVDPAFRKYPHLPVLQCAAYAQGEPERA